MCILHEERTLANLNDAPSFLKPMDVIKLKLHPYTRPSHIQTVVCKHYHPALPLLLPLLLTATPADCLLLLTTDLR
jgi:hypothetical protein